MTKEKGLLNVARSKAAHGRFGSVAQAGAAIVAAVVAIGSATVLPAGEAAAQGAGQGVARGPSGLPLPRFVSLKSGRVNARVGPGLNYAVEWLYLKPGLPMEIVQEFDTWRRVRDSDGAEGWVNQSLLSGKRTGIVAPWLRGKASSDLHLFKEPRQDSPVVAALEPGVIGTIGACNGVWCEMTFDGHTGWLEQPMLWGAYPGETIKD
ncbi:MAG: SH3 domain-containing protein [Rhizobiaceae bacterium]